MKNNRPGKKKPVMNPTLAAHRRFLVANGRTVEAKVSDNDLLAAELASKYDEATLRKAVTMAAAVAREAWRKDNRAAAKAAA